MYFDVSQSEKINETHKPSETLNLMFGHDNIETKNIT